MSYLSSIFPHLLRNSLFCISLLNKNELVLIFVVCLHCASMSRLYFNALAFSFFPPISTPLSCDGLYLTILSALLSFPASHLFFIFLLHLPTIPLLDRTFFLCDAKLITLPLFPSPSLCPSRVWKWLRWVTHLAVCMCVCVGVTMMACWETGERCGTGCRRRRRRVISYQHSLVPDVLSPCHFCGSIWNNTIFTAQDN